MPMSPGRALTPEEKLKFAAAMRESFIESLVDGMKVQAPGAVEQHVAPIFEEVGDDACLEALARFRAQQPK